MFGESYLPSLFALKLRGKCVHMSTFTFSKKKKKEVFKNPPVIKKILLFLVLDFQRATTIVKARLSYMRLDLKNKNYVSMGEGEEKRIMNEEAQLFIPLPPLA